MSFENKEWKPVSVHEVYLHWLKAEREKAAEHLEAKGDRLWPGIVAGFDELLDSPDLTDPEQNRRRMRVMAVCRWVFMLEVPVDTAWFEVRHLTDADLDSLHVVNYQEWSSRYDRNELRKAAARRKLQLRTPTEEWQPPVLWGHERRGPFTIIEGNNRLCAYVWEKKRGLKTPVYVGLSSTKSLWHLADDCPPLQLDLVPG